MRNVEVMYKWDYAGTPSRTIQTIVICKSGYGISTTLNRIVGREVFETSDVESCTMEMYSADHQYEYLLMTYGDYLDGSIFGYQPIPNQNITFVERAVNIRRRLSEQIFRNRTGIIIW